MTATATELYSSPEFLQKRIEEQVEYIVRYDLLSSTRPDKQDVVESAMSLLEQYQEQYLKLQKNKTYEQTTNATGNSNGRV